MDFSAALLYSWHYVFGWFLGFGFGFGDTLLYRDCYFGIFLLLYSWSGSMVLLDTVWEHWSGVD